MQHVGVPVLTTEDVRDDFLRGFIDPDTRKLITADFDQWIASVKADAWDAGFCVGHDKGIARQSREERWWLNPHRAPIRESSKTDD